MQRTDSWITAHYLDGMGAAEKTNGWVLPTDMATARCVWVQLNMNESAEQLWLREDSRLPVVVVQVLPADKLRQRCMMVDEGVLLNLRG